jgi:hypothetical protein
MFKLILGRFFELSIENGGIFARIGNRDFYWSRETGFAHD